MNQHTIIIANDLDVRAEQVRATVELLDEGNTLPFIARYRKERTGGLDEEQIREIAASIDSLRKLDERRATILRSVAEQGKLTPELEQIFAAASTLTELEDAYQPYRPKRRTRASIARERGLQALADLILEQPTTQQTPQAAAMRFLSPDVADTDAALAGARDIVAETIADHPDVRGGTRTAMWQTGSLTAQRIENSDDPRSLFADYYDFSLPVTKVRPHQVLALNRGENLKVLRVSIDMPDQVWQRAIGAVFTPRRRSPFANQLALAADDAAKRLLLPAVERDLRRQLTDNAEEHAIHVFSRNLRALLSQPPLAGHTTLAIDPGFRTGCKVAVVDATGRVMDDATIYPHQPQNQSETALKTLKALVEQYAVDLVVIGNGTASRETEQLVAELIRREPDLDLKYLIVSEAGASVYSASPVARAELPNLDVSLRGAVSLARRVQDPLAELVKIDPKAIGVGMYQHDVDQKRLASALDGVVENVVNAVGVDANTASPSLLTYVAGIGPKLAERIVSYREEHGSFARRTDLMDVQGMGPKSFEQAAGFLRIRNGAQPLDASAIHPESYPVAWQVLELAGLDEQSAPVERSAPLAELRRRSDLTTLAERLSTGAPTLADIFDQLIQPGRDPREDIPKPILRQDVVNMEDLKPGLVLNGTVRNVVDFGAFIDVGVKHDGLLHRSQIPRGELLDVGDVIEVRILKTEPERGRISLGWVSDGAS